MVNNTIPIDLRSYSPVDLTDTGSKHKYPEKGIALCLSGGGYRAMLFHLGALWRLNELGYLKKIKRLSSVSGGSITAGVLGYHWDSLAFSNNGVAQRFTKEVVDPIRNLGSTTIDVGAVLKGIIFPGSIADKVRNAYRKHLFGKATLQDLPDNPRFVINAANVQSGVLWRFMKPYMRDYRVGEVKNSTISLASAVAASTACPPILSPFRFKLTASDFTAESGMDLQYEPFTTDIVLTDGGVYDNLGLETAWKRYDTILVSDAGGRIVPEEKPKRDPLRHSIRVTQIIDNQVRAQRKRQLIESFTLRTQLRENNEDPRSDAFRLTSRDGAYWGIRTDITHYALADVLDCPIDKTTRLANTKTRLKRLDARLQERIINWGYAVCDAAVRKHVDSTLPAPPGFPYAGGVG